MASYICNEQNPAPQIKEISILPKIQKKIGGT